MFFVVDLFFKFILQLLFPRNVSKEFLRTKKITFKEFFVCFDVKKQVIP